MIDSALDLIAEAASNSLFIFCLCNLIIVMIIIWSKPGESEFQQENQVQDLPVVAKTDSYGKGKQKTSRKCMNSFEGRMTKFEDNKVEGSMTKFEDNKVEGSMTKFEDNKMEMLVEFKEDRGNYKNQDQDADHDDELRRRIEEFIDKVNREWKAELRNTSHLV